MKAARASLGEAPGFQPDRTLPGTFRALYIEGLTLYTKERICTMEEDMTRRLVRGILTLVLTTFATWLAGYLTNRILGPAEEEVWE